MTTGGPRNMHQDEVRPVAIRRSRFLAASGERQKPSSSRQRSREGVVHVSCLWQLHPQLSSIFPARQLLGLSIAVPSDHVIPTRSYYAQHPKVMVVYCCESPPAFSSWFIRRENPLQLVGPY